MAPEKYLPCYIVSDSCVRMVATVASLESFRLPCCSCSDTLRTVAGAGRPVVGDPGLPKGDRYTALFVVLNTALHCITITVLYIESYSAQCTLHFTALNSTALDGTALSNCIRWFRTRQRHVTQGVPDLLESHQPGLGLECRQEE